MKLSLLHTATLLALCPWAAQASGPASAARPLETATPAVVGVPADAAAAPRAASLRESLRRPPNAAERPTYQISAQERAHLREQLRQQSFKPVAAP